MQNKPNFNDAQMNLSIFTQMPYEKFLPLAGQKTNPIQTQFKPKQTQSAGEEVGFSGIKNGKVRRQNTGVAGGAEKSCIITINQLAYF